MEIAALSTVGSATGLIKDVMEQFKPSRAPYLLATSAGGIIIQATLMSEFSIEGQASVIIPICIFILVLSILTFFFKPFDEGLLDQNSETITVDIDSQFKLSRTTGLISGTACLFVLAYRRNELDTIFMVLWSAIILHCLVYMVYIVFRNIREEKVTNRSFFQISFMTSMFLALTVFSGSEVHPFDSSNLATCVTDVIFDGRSKLEPKPFETKQRTATVGCEFEGIDAINVLLLRRFKLDDAHVLGVSEPRRQLSLRAITAIYFGILWVVYICFWVSQLRKIWWSSVLVINS